MQSRLLVSLICILFVSKPLQAKESDPTNTNRLGEPATAASGSPPSYQVPSQQNYQPSYSQTGYPGSDAPAQGNAAQNQGHVATEQSPTGRTQEQTQAEPDPCGGPFRLRDLNVQSIQVSNQDVEQVIAILDTVGYTTISMDEIKGPSPEPQVSQPYYSSGNQTDTSGGTSSTGYNPYAPSYYTSPTLQGTPDSSSDAKNKKEKYACDELPVVVLPPPVSDHRLSFDSSDFLGLGGGQSSGSNYGGGAYGSSGGGGYGSPSSSGGSVGGDISPALHPISKPHTGETDNMLVFYLDEKEEDVLRLRELVSTQLDVRATQIYVEGLVLEVSEDGLDELGMEYRRVDPDGNRIYSVGSTSASPVAAGGTNVVNFVRDTLIDPFSNPDQVLLELQALVSKGDAEVLSRPSILTLNNRQATIQIIDIVQFPIQEATITASGDIVQSAFTFEAVRPGITLNLRPRVSPDKEFVSVEIDVTVEALVSANNGEVRNSNGEVIATKPGSSARRVQTFARIPNRTPIIIGGLIASDKEVVSNRVPVLGKIPVIGKLFGGSSKIEGKREVIIVLTPYVVGEDTTVADVSVPKDTSLFDVDNATLFVDTYRVKSEDVYDLRFLMDSPDFVARREQIEKMIVKRPGLRDMAPYRDFINGNIPGGSMFLNRMIFDLVRRRNLGEQISADQLIVLSDTDSGEPQVAFIEQLYQQVSGGEAATIVFRMDDTGHSPGADITLGNKLGSRNDHLWIHSYGNRESEQYAIVLESAADVDALVDAVISASIIEENGGYERFTVGRFEQGTILSVPNFDKERFYLVDRRVARIFTDIQHYYRASAEALERAYAELDAMEGTE